MWHSAATAIIAGPISSWASRSHSVSCCDSCRPAKSSSFTRVSRTTLACASTHCFAIAACTESSDQQQERRGKRASKQGTTSTTWHHKRCLDGANIPSKKGNACDCAKQLILPRASHSSNIVHACAAAATLLLPVDTAMRIPESNDRLKSATTSCCRCSAASSPCRTADEPHSGLPACTRCMLRSSLRSAARMCASGAESSDEDFDKPSKAEPLVSAIQLHMNHSTCETENSSGTLPFGVKQIYTAGPAVHASTIRSQRASDHDLKRKEMQVANMESKILKNLICYKFKTIGKHNTYYRSVGCASCVEQCHQRCCLCDLGMPLSAHQSLNNF